MLDLNDPRWSDLKGGYRVPYDPRPALARLRDEPDEVWDEFWNELHHQGDVGEASYAVVPHLIAIHRERDVPDWQMYAIIACIEQCRTERRNPPLPEWLKDSYWAAWRDVTALGCRDLARTDDETTVRAILGAIAYAKGLRPIGEVLTDFTADELAEMIESYRG